MPQPLSRVNTRASINLGNSGEYPLERFPEILRLAMRVISNWSSLESYVGAALVIILGASAKPGVAMYSSLVSNPVKMAALRAAADVTLENKDRELFLTLLDLYKSLAKQRNTIAHGVWGLSPEIPDAVLLTDQTVPVFYILEMESFLNTTPAQGQIAPTIDKSKVFVYKKKDFEKISEDIRTLSSAFSSYLPLPTARRLHLNDAARDELCSEPLIREALDRRRNHGKTHPKGKTQ